MDQSCPYCGLTSMCDRCRAETREREEHYQKVISPIVAKEKAEAERPLKMAELRIGTPLTPDEKRNIWINR